MASRRGVQLETCSNPRAWSPAGVSGGESLSEGGWGGRTRTYIGRLQRPLPYQLGDAPRRQTVSFGKSGCYRHEGRRQAVTARPSWRSRTRARRARGRSALPRRRARRRSRRRRRPPSRCPTCPPRARPLRTSARSSAAMRGQSLTAEASRSLRTRAAQRARSRSSGTVERGERRRRGRVGMARLRVARVHVLRPERDARVDHQERELGGALRPAAMRSPIPLTSAGRGSRKKGTSAPRPSAASRSASAETARGRRVARPRSTAPASLEPPPRPAPDGTRFASRISTPCGVGARAKNASAARHARFRASPGTSGPPPITESATPGSRRSASSTVSASGPAGSSGRKRLSSRW